MAVGSREEPTVQVCLDSGCTATLIDASLAQRIPATRRGKLPLAVNGIGSKHISQDFICFNIFFRGFIKGTTVTGMLTIEAHLVENLKPGLLIGMDVMASNGFELSFVKRKATIGACRNMEIPIEMHSKQSRISNIPVYSQKKLAIPPRSKAKIPVRIKKPEMLPTDRDLLFEPREADSYELYAHLVDANLSEVQVVNDSAQTVTIPRHTRLGILSDTDYTTAYRVSVYAEELARTRFKDVKEVKDLATSLTKGQYEPQDFGEVHTEIEESHLHNSTEHEPLVHRQPDKEQLLPNGVTVYGEDKSHINQLVAVVERYPIWDKPTGIVNIPVDRWMKIPLKEGWESRLPKPKVYNVGKRGREAIDRTFQPL